MCILRKEGRLEEFSTRCERGEIDMESRNTYHIGSEENATNLKRIRPDIVQKLNQKKREEMELKRMKREMEAGNNEEGEHWIFKPEHMENMCGLVKDSLQMRLSLITVLWQNSSCMQSGNRRK